MYTLVRNLSLREALSREMPSFLVAFFTAELFYKFHSFTLECLAFLGTWGLLSYLLALGAKLLSPQRKDASDV